ncbi:phosphotransferase [Streptomyces sp. DG2A-72]|uniref:phosphotransferase family protein n=1 Tax=Streptomyces sp. DG2A-72 TaxID=3051386 RepID=UPI00265C06EB|nr:phosphotransferase [Streptomyces sp. DG2A-72]MDO0934249.1 phosphotransferase [Streptomyces sp. DG2A-72]
MRFFAGMRRHSAVGEVVVGHHNSNHILPLGQPLAYLLGFDSGQVRAKFRVPLKTVEVVPRLWRESDVLRAVSKRVDHAPSCLWDFGDWSLHEYVAGHTLSEEPLQEPVGEERIAVLAAFFARLADVPVADLLPLPAEWPDSGDSQGFLERLATFTELRVHGHNRPRFGGLFNALDIPPDTVDRYLSSRPKLTRRPFTLLHTDVHRANVIVTPTEDGERLSVLDWELCLYGDPLHDLATHVVRMGYSALERKLAIELWADAMRQAGHSALTADLDQDLATYLGFEYVQSVFTDVMRAALALPAEPETRHFVEAAGHVRRALHRAWGALEPGREPVDEATAVRALREWHAMDGADRPVAEEDPERFGGRRSGGGNGWCPGADQPRGIRGTPSLRWDADPASGREAVTEAAQSLESLERHVC